MAARRKAPEAKGQGPKTYYVWILSDQFRPARGEPGPYGPYPLWNAKTFARISATKGKHHRAVTRGLDSGADKFVVRIYEKGTGERLL
jgi:hypothetical protein